MLLPGPSRPTALCPPLPAHSLTPTHPLPPSVLLRARDAPASGLCTHGSLPRMCLRSLLLGSSTNATSCRLKAAVCSAQSRWSIWEPSVTTPHPCPEGPRRGAGGSAHPSLSGAWSPLALGHTGKTPGGGRMFKASRDSDFVGKIGTIPFPKEPVNTRRLTKVKLTFHYFNHST